MSGSTQEIAGMFDRIAPTYDFLNHLFSLGIDKRWRARAIRALELQSNMRVLDCSAGTGDMSLEAHRQAEDIQTILLDPASVMLMIADGKAGGISPRQFHLVQGPAEQLPFRDQSFDRFMVAFGIRNFSDLAAGVKELCRCTRIGGRGVILEFTPDRSRRIDRLFQWYMNTVMGRVGAAVSRDRDAYNYLARTVENFKSAEQLRELFARSGFHHSAEIVHSFGIARSFVLERR